LPLSRRELLAGLTGTAFASCLWRPGKAPIAGSIVGGAHRRAHRIREGFHPPAEGAEDFGVVILGAGVAGLSAAWALERAGYPHFVVLDLEDAPGGTARSGTGPVTPFPWGAHYVPAPSSKNRPLVALLDEVGAVAGRDGQGSPLWAEEVLCRDPQERLFFKGEWYEGLLPQVGARPEELAEFRTFEDDMRRWATWRDERGRRGFAIPRARGSDAAKIQELDHMSMADYLNLRGWISPRLRWFVEYACRDDFGTTLGQTSAWAGIHYYAARLESASQEAPELLTWPEGNGRLVNHLARVAGGRLRLSALATDVLPGDGAVDVVYFDEASQKGKRLRARYVIFALPRFLAPYLLSPYRGKTPAHLGETVYGSWMVANLTLRDRPASRGFPMAWDNVLYDSPSLGYVVATHQSGRDQGPTVLTYYLPLVDIDPHAARARLMATSWHDWVDIILGDLGRAHDGLRSLVERIDVYLWGHAMVRPRPGFMWSRALALSAQNLGRVHFAHTDLSGLALFEEAQYWGIRAAEAIMRLVGHTYSSWLE